jgi:uncharacterized membrane protein
MKKINDWIGLNLTLAMGSMWCVYAFIMIAVAPLFAPGLEQFCIYLSTTIIQLVALPAILVGSNLLSQKAEVRAEQDHNAVMEIVQDIRGMMSEEQQEDSELKTIMDRLTAIEAALNIR